MSMGISGRSRGGYGCTHFATSPVGHTQSFSRTSLPTSNGPSPPIICAAHMAARWRHLWRKEEHAGGVHAPPPPRPPAAAHADGRADRTEANGTASVVSRVRRTDVRLSCCCCLLFHPCCCLTSDCGQIVSTVDTVYRAQFILVSQHCSGSALPAMPAPNSAGALPLQLLNCDACH